MITGLKKRTICLFLVTALIAVLFTVGCRGKNEGGSNEAAESPVPESTKALSTPTEEGRSETTQAPPKPGELVITAFSVGKADAILVSLDGKNMLIDTGFASSRKYITGRLDRAGITKLDCLLITHFDKDHVGSAADIVAAYDVDEILYPDYAGTRSEYEEFMEAIADHAGKKAVKESMSFIFGNALIEIFPAENTEEIMEKEEYDNDLSLVARLKYKDRAFLFTGDIEKTRIEHMLTEGKDLSCDWIKMPHHGKYQKAIRKLLDECSPSYAVITDSESDPAEEKTIEYLNEKGIKYYSAAESDVVTVFSGEEISITKQ